MKGLILMVGVLFAGLASADTLVPLTQPTLDGIGLSGRTACTGSAFTSSGILGACHTITASPCSGRGCQPVTLTTTYIANWDAAGGPLGVQACSVLRHHLPQANTTTYLNGHSAADCPPVNLFGTGSVVEIDGVPFYYASTDPLTGNELVNSNATGFLYLL